MKTSQAARRAHADEQNGFMTVAENKYLVPHEMDVCPS
jgi:hypothetical protein